MCETGTQKIEAGLKNAIEQSIQYNDMDILKWIKEPVDERLIRFLEEKLGNNLKHQSKEDKLKFWKQELKAIAKEKDIEIDKNALSRWFPVGAQYTVDPTKGGEQTRYNIYCLAYILDLSFSPKEEDDEIREFFNKIFRMRPYELKNKQEIVWWYYLNKRDYLWYPKGLVFYNMLLKHRPLSMGELQSLLAEYHFAQNDPNWYSNSIAMYKELLGLAKEMLKGTIPKSISMETLHKLIEKYVTIIDNPTLDGKTLYNRLLEFHHKPLEKVSLEMSDMFVTKLSSYHTAEVKLSLKKKKDEMITEEQLASLILHNWDELDKEFEMLTAKTQVKHLAQQAQYYAEIECDRYPDKNITKKSFSKNSKRDDEWADPSSNFLLSTITGVNVRENKVVNEKLQLFPAYYDLDNVLKERRISATTLRKILIILKLYTYTYSKIFYADRPSCALDEDGKYSKENCKKHINLTLRRAGFYPLYAYDEFDLLFLYAIETGSANPVEELRNLIMEVL